MTSSPDLSLDAISRLGEASENERRYGGQSGWTRAAG